MQLLNNIPSVFLISLVFLVSAQRPSNNNHRDLGPRELARQNQITQQILEAYIQKKLGLARNPNPLLRPPSILDILPANKQNEERLTRQLIHKKKETEALPEVEEEDPPEVEVEGDTELAQNEDERLQSVESEQIDSIYSEGT